MKKKEKQLTQFLGLITLLEGFEFIGLAKILNVELIENDKDRKIEEIIENMIDNFIDSNKKRRTEILNIMREASKGR